MNDILTVIANLAGVPGLSVPFDFDSKGLPFGIQVLSNHFDEQSLFDIGFAIESGAPFQKGSGDV